MILDLLKEDEWKLVKKLVVKKGEIIFRENDECFSIGIIKSGQISISSLTFEGNEIIYNSLKSGDIFGNNLIF